MKIHDGTQINLFYYKNQWRISTTGCIDAFDSYWKSNYSFGNLFVDEFFKTSDIRYLETQYCYSFILCHPDNNNVVQHKTPKLYHIMTRNIRNFIKYDIDINVAKPNRRYFDDINDLWDYIDYMDIDNYTGIVASHPERGHYRFNSAKYYALKFMIKNEKNDEMIILKNIENYNNLDILISNIPKFQQIYNQVISDIDSVCKDIYKYYHKTKIRRIWVELPFYVKPLIYEIHKLYINKIRKWEHNKIITGQDINKPILDISDVNYWFKLLPPKKKIIYN